MDLSRWWPLEGAGDLRRTLEAAYGDPGRGYHDLRHLAEVFERLDELAVAGTRFERTTALLAAWFHDAVYDGRPGAEARSAAWARVALPEQGVDSAVVAEVARLVAMTEHHRPEPDDPEGCALSDADLAILAATPVRYAEYVADVRAEYASVPDEQFRLGRAAVLAELAAKPTLFATSHAQQHWEEAARRNLGRELLVLTG